MALNISQRILTKNDCYKSGKRITPIGMQLHTIGTAQNTAESLAEYWDQSGIEACVHYCVDAEVEGKVLKFLPEDYRSWADAGFGNGNLITVELMESDYMQYVSGTADYTITNESKFKADITRAYNTAIEFFAYICKQYGWDPTAKLSNGLYVVSSHYEGNVAGLSSAHVDPTHIWDRMGWTMDGFRKAVKEAMDGVTVTDNPDTDKYYRVRLAWENEDSQIGAYTSLDNAKAACIPGYTVYDWDGNEIYTNSSSGTQTSVFVGLTEPDAAKKILDLCAPIALSYGLFPSVCAAQTILESGFGTTELAQKANNVCGMKTMLSHNDWPGTTWDGVSKVNIRTAEQDTAGNVSYEYDDFRAYPCVEHSIADRCAYLLGAKKDDGETLRYAGIKDCADYRSQIELIKAGGYATDVSYVSKLCNIIERYTEFDMTMYDGYVKIGPSGMGDTGDTGDTGTDETKWYRVRKDWDNAASQIGAFTVLENAQAVCDANAGYFVYDWDGNEVYASSGQTLYRIQTGAFEIKANASNQVIQLGTYGFDAFIFEEDNLYKVQAGSYNKKSNAESAVKILQSAGFSAFIR